MRDQVEPQEILDITRKAISDHAENDRDKWFYANRFVFARLQLDERKTKTQIKKDLFEANKPCHYCNKPFEKKMGVHLHRLNGERGYSFDNCALMHPNCHKQYHAENPPDAHPGQPSEREGVSSVAPILGKVSKRYDHHSFFYWWDISPGLSDKLNYYEAVEFEKKDTGEKCCVQTATLKEYLTKERQTSRGNGNWGIKVLKDREDELAFEPGNRNDKWLFLPVVWLNDTQED
jgi:hypothetical protein